MQLKSIGFNVLYFPYKLIVDGFESFGINAASEESTPEKEFQSKIRKWSKLQYKDKLAETILRLNSDEVKAFFTNLGKAVSRYITMIYITPLHGRPSTLQSIDQAITFIKDYILVPDDLPVNKYEITIKYNNGDQIEGIFNNSESAIEFLMGYSAPKSNKK